MQREELDGGRVFLLRGFLSHDECAAQIRRSEAMTYEPGRVGGAVVDAARNNERVLFDDVPLAEALFHRAAPWLPAAIAGETLVGFNERWRFYRYDPGQAFQPHRDGAYTRFRERQESRLTFMVYLNDDAVGGETRFFRTMEQAFAGEPYLSVAPTLGAALVFEHGLWHEGAAVQQGRKYVLRTDVMYGRTPR